LWKGQDAKQIVKTLLDVLVATLRLDFAYVRLNDPVGGGPIEMERHDQLRHLAAEPGLVAQTLTQSLGANPRKWPPRAKNPFGRGSLAVVPLGSARDDEIGVIIAGSERADFPWQTEAVVLSVAANQAAIGLASARAYEQERLRAEALALLASERNLRLTLDTVPINIQMLRPDGSLLYANQGVLDYMGITLEDVQKDDYRARFFHPEDVERLREERREALTRAVPFENEQRVLRKDGTYRWFLVRYSPLLNEQGGIDRWYVVGTDIEDRKQAEARIRRLVDANIIGIFVGDLEGRIFEANDAFLSIIGYDRGDLVSNSLNWTELTPPEWRERDMRALAELTSTGTTRAREKEYIRKDGSRVPVLIGGALVQEGGREGVVFVLDLTERKRAEEALRELESKFAHMNRVSMMGELAASLAHEITQPIGSARNNARTAQNFLKMQPPEPNEVLAALDRLIGNVDRATEIIDRIRDNIKKAPPRNERFDLNAAINEVIALAQNVIVRSGVSVHIGLADGSLLVQGDRVQLQQVVLNLILNAVEAMGPAHAGERNLLVSTEREDTGVRVAVRDSGPGIDRRQLERVFESFYTTKPGGTGMGLSVSRSIVDAHGGRLWAEVNEPQGAVFQFTWPGAEARL
jgi:PAS domain S-box-containing protein